MAEVLGESTAESSKETTCLSFSLEKKLESFLLPHGRGVQAAPRVGGVGGRHRSVGRAVLRLTCMVCHARVNEAGEVGSLAMWLKDRVAIGSRSQLTPRSQAQITTCHLGSVLFRPGNEGT